MYRPKLGPEMMIPLFLLLIATSTWLLYDNLLIMGFLVLLFLLIVLYCIFSLYYIISDDNLIIKIGFLYSKKIPVTEIKKITETNGFFSASATTINRLEIYLQQGKKIKISPKDKVAFLMELIRKNPAIELNLVYKEPY
jgi:hypothetical protein